VKSKTNRADFTGGRNGAASRAFTLIELPIVIAIIAVLSSIVMPSISGAREHGMAVTCSTHLHGIGQAMASYLAEGGGGRAGDRDRRSVLADPEVPRIAFHVLSGDYFRWR
jgi:prepilin-type N-terminal cleavage/methylation domain-containing protein